MLKASEADHLGDLTLTEDVNLVVAGSFELFNATAAAFAYAAVKVKRSFDIVHGEVGTQSDTFGGDDVAQLFALGALDLDIAFGDQALEVPVDRAHGDAELIRESHLGDIGIGFDVGEHLQRAIVFLFSQLCFHIIQELNYKPIGADVKSCQRW